MKNDDKKFYTILVSHIPREDRERVKSFYKDALPTLEITLGRVLHDKIEESLQKEEKETLYDKPNALAYLSDQRGYRRAIREVLKLLGES